MSRLIAFNKPYGVLSQFTDAGGRATLADYIGLPGVYPAGRLDRDSEGLLLLTDDGALKSRLSEPAQQTEKVYLVQVEGIPDVAALQRLTRNVELRDGPARATIVELLAKKPGWLWRRTPAVRQRKSIPTSWLMLTITEGRNRQVRRMTAAIGCPALRLVRIAIGQYKLGDLQPGESRDLSAQLSPD